MDRVARRSVLAEDKNLAAKIRRILARRMGRFGVLDDVPAEKNVEVRFAMPYGMADLRIVTG
jgi:hypothetical protein